MGAAMAKNLVRGARRRDAHRRRDAIASHPDRRAQTIQIAALQAPPVEYQKPRL
jgi:hypothetical protein